MNFSGPSPFTHTPLSRAGALGRSCLSLLWLRLSHGPLGGCLLLELHTGALGPPLCFWIPTHMRGFSTASFWGWDADDKVQVQGGGPGEAIFLVSTCLCSLSSSPFLALPSSKGCCLFPVWRETEYIVVCSSSWCDLQHGFDAQMLHSLGLWKHKSLSLLTKPDFCKWMPCFLVCYFCYRFMKINLAL